MITTVFDFFGRVLRIGKGRDLEAVLGEERVHELQDRLVIIDNENSYRW